MIDEIECPKCGKTGGKLTEDLLFVCPCGHEILIGFEDENSEEIDLTDDYESCILED